MAHQTCILYFDSPITFNKNGGKETVVETN